MRPASRNTSLPALRPGQRLSQAEFHRRYEQYPEDVKFELVGGVVYMASPLGHPHGSRHGQIGGVLWFYQANTVGVEVLDNATTILDDQAEPQPDTSLRILTEYGGQSRIDQGRYLTGAPELIAEVADSRTDVALGGKRDDYERTGVNEYLVVNLHAQQIHWFDLSRGGEIRPRQGVYRSRVFPGLWVNGPALLAGDAAALLQTAQQGIASPAHARFVARLQRAHRRHGRHAGS
jgi:hypothetical protein